MLKPAKLYEAELILAFSNLMMDDSMKWWQGAYEDTAPKIADSFWTSIQLVSINKNNELCGYFNATVERPENYVSNLSCAKLPNGNKALFAKDIINFLYYLLNYKNFPKICWCVTVGNPIEKAYDKFIKNHGGRIVGVYKNHILINGKYYDEKHYEYVNNYWECSYCKHKCYKEEEIICWKCGIGTMNYKPAFKE